MPAGAPPLPVLPTPGEFELEQPAPASEQAPSVTTAITNLRLFVNIPYLSFASIVGAVDQTVNQKRFTARKAPRLTGRWSILLSVE